MPRIMRSPRTLLALLGIALIVAGVIPMSAQARWGHAIDLSLSRWGRPTVGTGERSRDASDQSMRIRIRPYGSERVTLGIRKLYDSPARPADIKGCSDLGRLHVRYGYDHVDVSEDVKGRGFLTEELRRGQLVRMGIVLRARGRLVSTVTCVIRTERFDAVQIVISGG